IPGAAGPGGAPQDLFSILQALVASGAMATGSAGFSNPAAAMTGSPGLPVGGAAPGVALPSGLPGFAASAAPAMSGGAAPALQGPALIGSLTQIQRGDLSGVTGGNLALAGTAATTNVLHELKATSVGAGMGPVDLMTLDIVAMLFDQLFDDPEVP